jgi:hypothetical protein
MSALTRGRRRNLQRMAPGLQAAAAEGTMSAPIEQDRDRDPHPDQLSSEERQPRAETPERPGDETRQELEQEDSFEATDN